MKKITMFLVIMLVASTIVANAQKYMTKSGSIKFSSETPIEKIEAVNRQVNSALDFSSGNFVFKVLIPGFEFKKALMQEHFNENYMESDKFPNATFNGKISNIKDVSPGKDGVYKVVAEGDLSIHGVTNKVRVNGTLEIKGGKVIGKSVIEVAPKDYNINIPKAVIKNISEAIQVEINITLDKLGS
jgi:hypothetical protein